MPFKKKVTIIPRRAYGARYHSTTESYSIWKFDYLIRRKLSDVRRPAADIESANEIKELGGPADVPDSCRISGQLFFPTDVIVWAGEQEPNLGRELMPRDTVEGSRRGWDLNISIVRKRS